MPRVLQVREALNEALAEEMERDERVFIMGEEVGHYDGAYKVTRGLLARFGPRRVWDTPISEGGFAGIGIGAAMVGLRPVIEFMTFNFSLVAFDQLINNAAKIRQMSGGQLKVPIVFRGGGGAARMLAAQHSQATETFYAHCPGLKVVIPSTPAEYKGLLKSSIRDDNPVIFIESELMYGMKGEVPDGEYTIPLGVADVKRSGDDCTIVSWGRILHTALEAAEVLSREHGIECDVIDPRTIRPLDEQSIFTSVTRTGRCVVVHEGWRFGGVGAEVVDRIQATCFDWLDAPIERVCNVDVPQPYARNLEEMVMPSVPRIVEAVRRACYR